MNSWERQPKEGVKAYQAFEKYRAMGKERSIAKVAKQCKKNVSLLNRWSQRYGWVQRVRDFDGQLEHKNLEDEEDLQEEMRQRHLKFSHSMQEVARQRLVDMTGVMLEKPQDVKGWLEFAFKVERECLGMLTPGTQIQVNTQVNSDLTIASFTAENIAIGMRLYPKALSMLTEKQKAELEEYRKDLDGD